MIWKADRCIEFGNYYFIDYTNRLRHVLVNHYTLTLQRKQMTSTTDLSTRPQKNKKVNWFALFLLMFFCVTLAQGINNVEANGQIKQLATPSPTPTPSALFHVGQFVYLQPTSSRPHMSPLDGYLNAEQLVLGWANTKYIFFGTVSECNDLDDKDLGEFSVIYGDQLSIQKVMYCGDAYYYLLDRELVPIWVRESSLVSDESKLSANGLYFTDDYVPKDRWRKPGEVFDAKINGNAVRFSLDDISIETYIQGPYNIRIYRLILTVAIKNGSAKELSVTPDIARLHFDFGKTKWESAESVIIYPYAETKISFLAEIHKAGQTPFTDAVLAVNAISPGDSSYYQITPDAFFYKLELQDALRHATTPVANTVSNSVSATNLPSKPADLTCLKNVEPESGKVLEIIDGNTVRVAINGLVYTVRYLGVEIPENTSSYWDKSGQPSAKNGELVYLKEVKLYKDAQDKDDRGRLLRYVVVDNIFANYQLIYEGYAVHSTSNQYSCQSLFQQAQQESQTYMVGLWQPAPIYTPEPLANSATGSSAQGQTYSGNNNQSYSGNSTGSNSSTYPSGATAICNDGTASYARHRRGACSWHGGVRIWLVWVSP